MPLKYLAIIFLAVTLFLPVRIVCGDEFDLQFTISPDGSLLKPLGEPVSLAVTVSSSDGHPAAEGWVVVMLDAPPRSMFVSTDFPVVEGTRLLEMRVPVMDGKAKWHQVFPIRGEYRLTAEFDGAAGSKTSRVFTFNVHEHYWKWFVLGAFALGIFIAGLIAGRIFSGPREVGRWQIGLGFLLGMLCNGAVGENVLAKEATLRNYQATLEIAPASVGVPTRIRWRLHAAGVEHEPAAKLTLTVKHLEKKAIFFALEKISVAGEFALDYHFTDGADYLVTAITETGDGATLHQEQTVSVTAVSPPWRAKLRTLLLFLAVIAAGLAMGRWSRSASRAGKAYRRTNNRFVDF